MKKQLLVLSTLCLVLSACENKTAPRNSDKTNQEESTNYEPDNTGRNIRDRSGQTVTAGDQSETNEDRTITKEIRKLIIEDDSLSNNGKNVKVITINGIVTLRGPVKNEREKNNIAKKASQVRGVRNVDNQLEVTANNAANREVSE